MGRTEVLEVDEAALTAACVETVLSGFLVLAVETGSERVVSVTPQTAAALGVEARALVGVSVEELLGQDLAGLPAPQPRPGWSSVDRPLALSTVGTVRAVRLAHRAETDGRTLLVLRDLSETVAAMAEWQAELQALTEDTLQIEFTTAGEIIQADARARARFGYSEDELTGRPHQILCAPEEADSVALHNLWAHVSTGHSVSGVFRRRDHAGAAVWLRGHYVPIPGPDGQIARIVLIARDIDGEMRRQTDLEGRVTAIDRSQAVAEFALDGTVTAANENFLTIMDYDRAEVVGLHHQALVEPEYAASTAYQDFWDRLRAGEFVSGDLHRHGRDVLDIWLPAAYKPVLDAVGRPRKVIEDGLDVTD